MPLHSSWIVLGNALDLVTRCREFVTSEVRLGMMSVNEWVIIGGPEYNRQVSPSYIILVIQN